MNHLSASEFVDFADGTLPRRRAAHVDGCDACRAQAATVRDALTFVKGSADIPEPSPLFWDHFSARVHEAVAATPRRRTFASGFRWRQPIAAAAILVLVVSAGFLLRDARTTRPSSAPAPMAADQDPSADRAAAWAVLTAAAADLQLDEARDAGMDVASGAVDHAVTQLNRDELSELGRLLQSELKRASN
jgi:hypothetical protein